MGDKEKYINNKMNSEELEQYTAKLLRAKFDKQRSGRWQKLLKEGHGVDRKDKSDSDGSRRWLWGIAAVAASLLLLWIINPLEQTSNALSPTELAQQYIYEQPYPNALTRKGPEVIPQIRLNAAEAYNAEDYPKAIRLGLQIANSPQANVSDCFFLAMSYLYLKDYPSAAKYFQQAQSFAQQTDDFQQESNWLLALTYLQMNEPQKAKALLQKIVAQKEWKMEKAEKLLDQL